MVGKKVKNPSLGSSKTDRVYGLANYIVSPENSNESEKCIYSGARGFTLADTHAARKAEMVSLASEAVRSKDPINHYILSWREGERPGVRDVSIGVVRIAKQFLISNVET